ncbi:MAG: hypothetical protein ACLFSA_10945 [Spirochaetaceae bacterium]
MRKFPFFYRATIDAALITLLLLIPAVTAYGDITNDIEQLAQEFSVVFKNNNPDIVFKPNLGIIPFENNSPDAKKYNIGEAVTQILESSFSRSLIFNIIDEGKRKKALEEIQLALSGLADDDRVEIGMLEGIDYFISGSVTQIGDSFTIGMKAVEVNTGRVIFTQKISVPKFDIIDYSEKLAAAYVSPYGLGLEFHHTPWYYLASEMNNIEGHIVEGWPSGLTIHYRISRSWLTWLGFEGTAGAFRLEDSHESTEYQQDEIGNMDTSNGEFPDKIYYYKERTYISAIFGTGYVFNVNRNFNVTLGGDFKLGMSFLQQFYRYADNEAENIEVEHEITSKDMTLLIFSPTLKLQYYITPRVALNMGYSYGYQIQQPEDMAYFYASTTAEKFPPLHKLDPNEDPKGEAHITDFSGHRLIAGFGFYF